MYIRSAARYANNRLALVGAAFVFWRIYGFRRADNLVRFNYVDGTKRVN